MMTNKQKVAALYVAVYNRSPDLDGLNYWESQLNNGVSYAEMATGFISHPIFQREYGALSNKQFVEEIYINLLGRAGDSTGINFWTKALEGGQSVESFLTDFLEGVYSYNGNDYSANIRKDLFLNRMKAALDFTERMGEASNFAEGTDVNSLNILSNPKAAMSSAAIKDVNNSPDSLLKALELNKMMSGQLAWTEPNQNISYGKNDLTHKTDDIWGTSYNDTFYADHGYRYDKTIQQLNTGDVLDGGKGRDSLYATLTGRQWNDELRAVEFMNVTKPVLASVENLYLNANAAGQILDLSSATGVEYIQINSGYAMDVLSTGSANLSAYDTGSIGSNFYDITGQDLSLTVGSNTTLGLHTSQDPNAIKTTGLAVSVGTSYYNQSVSVLHGSLKNVVTANFAGGKVDISDLALDSLVTLNSNRLDFLNASEKITSLKTLNISPNSGTAAVRLDKVETELSTINIGASSGYSTSDYEVDLSGSSLSSAVTVNLAKVHNLFYTADAQRAVETFVLTNKNFNRIEINNFDVKGDVKDKIDLSAFTITSLGDLQLTASAADNDDLQIAARNGEFDGRIILKGVLADGDNPATVVTDSFIFA